MDRGIWNHPYPDPQLQLVNGSFMLHGDIAAVGGMNPMPYFETSLRSSNVPYSNLSMAANPGPPQHPYLHASSASSSNQMPPFYVQTGAPGYNPFANGHASISVNPQMDFGRTPYKRKNPAVGNTNAYYSAGSSSNMSAPSTLQPVVSDSTLNPHYWTRDPPSIPNCHRNNTMSTACEGPDRNVRSRQNHALNLEYSQSAIHPLSNFSHHHPSTNTTGLGAASRWSNAHLPSGTGSVNYNMEIDVGYPPNLVHNSRSSSTVPVYPRVASQVMGVSHNTVYNRATPYNTVSSFQQTLGFAAPFEDRCRLGREPNPPSRPLSIIGRSDERNARSRTLYDRYHPNQAVPTLYGSRSFYDQHHDMRLDIDNMSYEELLALEESIGSVSTGLSENTIPVCLTESVYHSSKKSHDVNCAICLEEYEDLQKLGKLKCGHSFHTSCIKKWLLIKNVCPICKGEALPDSA